MQRTEGSIAVPDREKIGMQDFRMETFLAVCRHLNYTRAAEELCITQPAVSLHIRFLEEHYGCRLFESEGRRMTLTSAGRILYSAALTMKHDEGLLRAQMCEASENRRLAFGATVSIGEGALAGWMERFLRKCPQDRVQVTVSNTRTLLRMLDEGSIDFAFVEGYFSRNDYDLVVLSREPFIAVTGSGHFFEKEPTQLEDLLSETVLLREPGSGSREILERALKERQLSPEDFAAQIEVNSIHVIKQLAAEGKGVTFAYRTAVKKELEEGKLREIRLQDFSIEHEFYFIWRKGSIYAQRYREIYRCFMEEE